MATPSTAPLKKSSRHRWFIAALVLVLLVVAGVAAAGLWLYSASRRALPQIDGALQAPGLSSPVTVVRDAHGVAHISAATLSDLFFSQGYVTAQDRLWQMDMVRRSAAGELSEILAPRLFGAGVLKHDKRQRLIGARRVAAHAASALSGDEKTYFEAYARGVNAFIQSHQDSLPAEFRLLRYSPKPWTTSDSFLIGLEMAQELQFYQVRHIWLREKVVSKLSPQLATDLYPNTSWRDHPPTALPPDFNENPPPSSVESEESRRVPQRGSEATRLEGLLPEWLKHEIEGSDERELRPGSNNWVVSGEHTASGKPLLANDMHLGQQVPSVWYETHLTGPNFDVAGVTFAGVPFIVVGHNQRIGWGFTNVGPATIDLYVENFNGRGEYQTPGGWLQAQHRNEMIHVRGSSDVVVDVITTRHGPIISDILPGETRKIALKWTVFDQGTLENPFFAINRAQNWEEFRKAIARFGAPSQNAVYADVDGHISYTATGRVPMRAAESGGLPVSGADDAHEWTGYIPLEQMPSTFDPPTGLIASANGRITPDGYPRTMSYEWGGSERTQRIYRLLQSGKKFVPADMLAIQTDITSEFDLFLAQRFVYAVDRNRTASARARQAADILRGWQGRVDRDAAAPTIVAKSERELVRSLLEPKLGKAGDDPLTPLGWKQYAWEMQNVWLENVLLRQSREWLPANVKSYDELLASAVEDAVMRGGAPPNLAEWKWGEQVALDLEHPLFGRIPFFKRSAGPGHVLQSGNGNTVKQVGKDFGPSERLTIDFSNLDGSTLNVVTGESGNIFSPYFMDHWPAWYGGATFTLPFSATAVGNAKAHTLTLEPAK